MIKPPDDCLNDAAFWAIDKIGLQRHRLTCSCVYDTAVKTFEVKLPPSYLQASHHAVPDFVVVVNPWHWEQASDDDRLRLMDEAMKKVEVKQKRSQASGRTVIAIRKEPEQLTFVQGLLW